jgi:hypothetical protein
MREPSFRPVNSLIEPSAGRNPQPGELISMNDCQTGAVSRETRRCRWNRERVIRLALLLTVAVAIVSATGCGDGLRAVSGKLVVDGKPGMDGARVVFVPLGNTKMANGVVGADGAFEMMTYQKKGVMPGDYKVTMINSTKSIPQPEFSAVPAGSQQVPPGWFEWQAKVTKLLENPPKEPGWIPKSYSDISKTPLKWSVPKDGPKATFEISSGNVAKAGDAQK